MPAVRVLEGAGGVRLPVATGRRRAARRAARLRPYVGPFYGASVYSCSLFVRRSTCGSYRVVSYRDILFDIVLYLSFLANVNSSSCSLYVIVRPSVVCLSSVCRLSVCNVNAPYSDD